MWNTRIYGGLFSDQEQRLIAYSIRRLPAWVTPDHMSVLALVGALLSGLAAFGAWYSSWFIALFAFGLLAHWAGDSFDGALARYRGIGRPKAGLLIDRGADILSYFIIAFGLGFSPYLSLVPALALLVAVLLNAVYTLLLSATDKTTVVGVGGIGATEGRFMLIAWVMGVEYLGFRQTSSPYADLSAFDLAMLGVLGVILLGLSVQILKRIAHHSRLESVRANAESNFGEPAEVPQGLYTVATKAADLSAAPGAASPNTSRRLSPLRGTIESGNRRIRL